MVVTRNVAKHLLQSLAQTDHRLIGAKQNLFFFDEVSQGSCFFLPRGAHIYNKLKEYLRSEYKRRHYEEVITPNMYNCSLWETSGHWQHYKQNMIRFQMGEQEFSLKPMNCPGHCVMFKHLEKSIKSEDLPIRWAEFGVLHRNELSGSILGLTRGRRFQQDDAHIFCTPEQVESEVSGCLDFATQVYGQFDFKFDLALSLRPKDYMGDERLWDRAEEALRVALDKTNLNWVEQKEEGAFYGPKIDMIVKDCLNRSHQCATIQLDFQLPERFELTYKDLSDRSSSQKRPVMIHRAILGSIERFFAMVLENCQGRWPFWLSPVQALVVPVHEKLNNHASSIRNRLVEEGFMVDCELDSSQTLNRKIREAELSRYNFILVIGDKEAQSDSVMVRSTVDKKTPQVLIPLDKLIELFRELCDKKVKHENKELLLLSRREGGAIENK